MKYKKIIVSILSLTFLAGCGGKNQSTTSPETTPTDTTTLPETKPSEELPSVSLPEEDLLLILSQPETTCMWTKLRQLPVHQMRIYRWR